MYHFLTTWSRLSSSGAILMLSASSGVKVLMVSLGTLWSGGEKDVLFALGA